MANKTVLFWHRRDLRIADNHGLYQAAKLGDCVIPVFIFDTTILQHLPKNDARVTFIYEAVQALKAQYNERGNNLEIYFGNPVDLIPEIAQKHNVDCVISNRDYEPKTLERDYSVEKTLKSHKINWMNFKDHVVFEKDEVVKNDGLPYTVFTPYMNKWKSLFNSSCIEVFPSDENIGERTNVFTETPSLESIGFVRNSNIELPPQKIPVSILKNYDKTRDIPSIKGTSRLGMHLRFGTLSIRKLTEIALKSNEKFLNELIWRDFYSAILFHFPHTENSAFKTKYDFIPWVNNESDFEKWCQGKTGYPIVDAGMRELNATGFMHNRVRMITASFLCKHLLIDWKWGERYFAEKLLDFDLASNVGGWQWAASSGCDAVPYFRIFNPMTQQERFDPQFAYIKQWVPEFGTNAYPQPMVEHKFARNRAIETYKTTLNEEK